jgi:tetratricopeptide (TPR) repeat protein
MEHVARSHAAVTLRARALNSLAIGYARLGMHQQEIDAYDRAIVLQPDPQAHAILLANQAEAFMALGSIIRAVRGYKASLGATPGALMIDSGVTTLWGLAVSLDRSGDLDGALERIRTARSYDPVDARINGPNWFYVPEHDEDWYAALGHWQRARHAKGEGDLMAESYRDALASWRSFIERAPMSDPWLPLASRRLQQCERERDERLGRLLGDAE